MKKIKTIGLLSAAAFFVLAMGAEAAYANPFDPLHNRALRDLVMKPVKVDPTKLIKPIKVEPAKLVDVKPVDEVKPVKRVKINPIVIDGPIEQAEAVLLPHEVTAMGIIPQVVKVEPIKGRVVDIPEPPAPVERVTGIENAIEMSQTNVGKVVGKAGTLIGREGPGMQVEKTRPIGLPLTAPVDGGGPRMIMPVPEETRPIGPPETARVDGGGIKTSPNGIAGDVVRKRAPKMPTEEERNRFKPTDLKNQFFGIGRR